MDHHKFINLSRTNYVCMSTTPPSGQGTKQVGKSRKGVYTDPKVVRSMLTPAAEVYTSNLKPACVPGEKVEGTTKYDPR